MGARVGKEAKLPVVEQVPRYPAVSLYAVLVAILVWLDDPEDRLIIFPPSGHPRVAMWSWGGAGSSMLGDLGGPSVSHSLATVFVYRAYRLDLQDMCAES